MNKCLNCGEECHEMDSFCCEECEQDYDEAEDEYEEDGEGEEEKK